MLCATPDATLCVHHLRRAMLERGEAPPAPPLVAAGALANPWAVRRSLKRVFSEVAAGRMDPRNARVLAHLGRLLLFGTRRHRPRRRGGEPSCAMRGGV
jgi:hypothetical protein